MPTLEDVARHAGVSASTVSRAFTSPNRINAKTKARIFEAAAKVNYLPLRTHTESRPAISVEPGVQKEAIGFHFFAADVKDELATNPFYGPVLAGVVKEASKLGHKILLSSSVGRREPLTPDAVVLDHLPQALIVAGNAAPEIIERIAANVNCCVLVDAVDKTGRLDSVIADNVGGSAMSTNYVIGLGHRRIGFIISNVDDLAYRERLDGYLHALYWAGIDVDKSLIIRPKEGSDYKEMLHEVLQRPDRPTAIVSASDDHIYAVYKACAELGLRIPADLSVVGFDNSAYGARMIPSITTVDIDSEDMGAMAFTQLMQRLNERAAGLSARRGHRIVAYTRLVERESAGPVGAVG